VKWGLLGVLWGSIGLFVPEVVHARPDQQVVQSVRDYRLRMQNHRLRVIRIALRALELDPQRFSELTAADVMDFLSLHDQSKVNENSEFLAVFNIHRFSERMGYRLYNEIYGHSIGNLLGIRRQRAESLVNRINEMDRSVRDVFFTWKAPSQSDPELWKNQLILIEKVADSLDRELNELSAEELGRTPWSSDRYFEDPQIHQLLSALRREYQDLTKDLGFEEFRRGQVQFIRAGSALIPVQGFMESSVRFCTRLMSAI